MTLKLPDKIAIITGGGTGIGKATAFLFASEGAKVIITGRRENILKKCVTEAGDRGFNIDYRICDVSKETQCKETVKYVWEKFGRIDILFNNAGVVTPSMTHETSSSLWDQTFDANVKGTFLMSRYVLPIMIQQNYGIIVNNSSIIGLKGSRNFAAYVSSKGAVTQLTRSMALEYAKNGIRVNAVCPGSVYTPMVDNMYTLLGNKEEVEQRYISAHPIKRLSQPEEIAHAVLFLCDDSVRFMTGIMLSIDGGLIAK